MCYDTDMENMEDYIENGYTYCGCGCQELTIGQRAEQVEEQLDRECPICQDDENGHIEWWCCDTCMEYISHLYVCPYCFCEDEDGLP